MGVPVFSPSAARRFALLDKIQRSGMPAATRFKGVESHIILWDNDLIADQAAGCSEPTDEDKRRALLKIITSSCSLEMKTKATAAETAESSREGIRVQAEFILEQSGKGIHIIEQLRESGPLQHDDHQDDQQEDSDETQEEELDPQVMSMMRALEVMAFVKGRQARGGWKTKGRGRGAGAPGARLPAGKGTGRGPGGATALMKCFNCGKPGHKAADCRGQSGRQGQGHVSTAVRLATSRKIARRPDLLWLLRRNPSAEMHLVMYATMMTIDQGIQRGSGDLHAASGAADHGIG